MTNNRNFHRIVFYLLIVNFSIEINSDEFLSSAGYSYPHPSNPPVIQFEEPLPPPLYLPPPSVVLPPIFADEPPIFPPTPNPPSQTYLPPKPGSTYLPPAPPANDLFPPLLPPMISNDDSIVIPALPPQIIGDDSGGYLPPNPSPIYGPPPSSQQQIYQLKIENMSCVQGMQFRAIFKIPASDQLPVVDDSSEKCINSLGGNQFQMELMTFNRMLSCGVKRCGNNAIEIRDNNNANFDMCVKMRIPIVKGVRLPEDELITLRCKPQERILSQTKHIKLGTNKIRETIQGRSNKVYVASGGQQNQLKSTIKIFRKRPGTQIFDQNVHSDSVIHLGEELAMTAVIHDENNGWKNSLMGPVLITGLNSQKSALLVNQNGCVNSAMRTICTQQPKQIKPLTTELRFRAFLFQETPQGDEMVLSVKMQGCLHWQDCVKSDICNDNNLRNKRELRNSTESSDIENWESQLAFKVVPTKRDSNLNDYKFKNNNSSYNYSIFLAVVIGIGVLNVFLIIFCVVIMLKRKKDLMDATKHTFFGN